MSDARTRWILELIDRTSGPLKNISEMGSGASKRISALNGHIEKLQDRSNQISQKFLGFAAATAGIGFAANRIANFTEDIAKQQTLTSQLFGETQNGIRRTTEEIQRLSAQGDALSKVFGDDYREVQLSVNSLMKNFKISSDEAFSLIEKGYLSGANASGDFLQQLKEYPAQFKAVGLEADQAIAIMGQSIKSGVWSDKGPDLIKEAGLSIKEMTSATSDAIKGLNLNPDQLIAGIDSGAITVFEAIQKVSAAMEGANTQARQTAIADIFRGAGEDAPLEFLLNLQNMNTELNDMVDNQNPITSHMMEQVKLQTQIAEQQQKIGTQLKPLTDSIGNDFLKIKSIALDLLSGLLGFAEAHPVISKFIVYTGLFTGGLYGASLAVTFVNLKLRILHAQLWKNVLAAKGFKSQISKAALWSWNFGRSLLTSSANLAKNTIQMGVAGVRAIGGYVAKLAIATAAQFGFNAAMLANPVGVIVLGVLAIGAAITGLIAVYDDWGAAATLVLALFTPGLALIINLVQSFRRHWETLKTAFSTGGMVEGLKMVGKVILDALLMPVQQLLELISNIPGMEDLAGKGVAAIEKIRKNLIPENAQQQIEQKAKERKRKEESSGKESKGLMDFLFTKPELDNTTNDNTTSENTLSGNGGGSGSGRSISMTLDIKNYYNVASEYDPERIANDIVGRINDRLRDSLIALG
jgi:hypothetical protein